MRNAPGSWCHAHRALAEHHGGLAHGELGAVVLGLVELVLEAELADVDPAHSSSPSSPRALRRIASRSGSLNASSQG